jgi:hypothetical protein
MTNREAITVLTATIKALQIGSAAELARIIVDSSANALIFPADLKTAIRQRNDEYVKSDAEYK